MDMPDDCKPMIFDSDGEVVPTDTVIDTATTGRDWGDDEQDWDEEDWEEDWDVAEWDEEEEAQEVWQDFWYDDKSWQERSQPASSSRQERHGTFDRHDWQDWSDSESWAKADGTSTWSKTWESDDKWGGGKQGWKSYDNQSWDSDGKWSDKQGWGGNNGGNEQGWGGDGDKKQSWNATDGGGAKQQESGGDGPWPGYQPWKAWRKKADEGAERTSTWQSAGERQRQPKEADPSEPQEVAVTSGPAPAKAAPQAAHEGEEEGVWRWLVSKAAPPAGWKPEEGPIYCECCNVHLNGPSQWEDHKVGGRHRKNHEKMGASGGLWARFFKESD